MPALPASPRRPLTRLGVTGALALSLLAPALAVGASAAPADALGLPPAGISLWHDLTLRNASGSAETLTRDAAGDLWYVDDRSDELVRVDADTHAQEAFPLRPGNQVLGIVGAPDGTLWYTDLSDHTINHLDPATGSSTPFALSGVTYTPSNLTMGPDGAVWFGDPFETALVRVDPRGSIRTVPEPRDERAIDIVAAPDGLLYYTRTGHDRVGTFDPATGVFSDVGVGAASGATLTLGASGAVWVDGLHDLTRIALDGTITTHPLPTAGPVPVRPVDFAGGDVVGDPEVELSFLDPAYGLGTLSPSGHVHFSRFDGSRTSIALDGEGHLWANDLGDSSLQWQ
jgi:streptogramin lyase